MTSDNTITLVGNITDDPELRFTPGGAAVANFTVAVNRRYKNQQGQWEDKLDGFFRCNCWREMAENVAESLLKGMRVVVTGRLQQRSWDDPEGNRRTAIEIQVDEVGPSLRWQTAQIQKSQRSGGVRAGASQQPGGQPGGAQWGPGAGGQTGSGSQWGGGQPATEARPGTAEDWGSPTPAPVAPSDEAGF